MMISKNRLIPMLVVGLLLVSFPLSASPFDGFLQGNFTASNLLAAGLTIATIMVIFSTLIKIGDLQNSIIKSEEKQWYETHGITPPEPEPIIEREGVWQRLYKRLTNYVPVEEEKDILFDHSYDGIYELDNSLPPWWVYMFYATILFAVVYMGYYQFSGYAPSTIEAYNIEVAEAEARTKALLASRPDVVDETNVTMLAEDNEIAFGQTIFQTNCAACHGMLGEGGVGPNMTDDYWIHGGSIKDVFRVIKYGVPEKGMISWQQQLRPLDMHRVASYIMTLHGTDPPNQKEAQGELYEENAADTTAAEGSVGMLEEIR